MDKKFSLGIDTSCYTTSVGIVSLENNEIIKNIKIPLKVKKGSLGLRQSEGFYQHVLNLGNIFSEIPSEILSNLKYIVVSDKPRNIKNSYMPVFNAGLSFAKALSSINNVELIKTSHQMGHIFSVFENNNLDIKLNYISVHLSGGTTEILKKSPSSGNFDDLIIGGSSDISAGQLIDRIGLKLGFEFPAGEKIEKHLTNYDIRKIKKLHFPISVKDNYINFSGAESYGYKYISENLPKEEILLSLLLCISKSISKALKNCINSEIDGILLTGGVASNTFIYEFIKENLDIKVYRPKKILCTDNGIGLSYYPILKKNLEIKSL